MLSEPEWLGVLAACVLLLFYRPRNRLAATPVESGTGDPAGWWQLLLSQCAVGTDVAHVLARLDPPPSHAQELADLSLLNREHGVRVLPAVNHLQREFANAEARIQRWQERSSQARAASVIIALLPVPLGFSAAIALFNRLPLLVLVAFGAAAFLTLFAWLWMRQIGRRALRDIPVVRAHPVSARTAALAVGGAVFVFLPSLLGAIGAVAAGLTMSANWRRFDSAQLAAESRRRSVERTWVTCKLACALAAGTDWYSALTWSAASSTELDQLAPVLTRLSWGIEAERAFAEADPLWQPVAAAISASAISGAPIASSLLNLCEYWQQQLQSQRLSEIEAAASRAMLPVSLLQLPAFFLSGLLPALAANLVPLIDNFLSTSAQ